MRIASFGCSFTFGTELRDSGNDLPWPRASSLTWPALVASKRSAQYTCMAYGGSGNLSILDRVLTRCCYFPDDIFIINWTFSDRFDYSDPAGSHFGNGQHDYLTARPGESDLVSNFYFRHMHSEYRDKITNLMYIKTAIDHLMGVGARFFMTCIDPVLFCQQWHAPPHVVKLQDEVRAHIHDFEGRNFLDWSRHRGFEITAAGHPLEQAHAVAADLMLPVMQDLLKI